MSASPSRWTTSVRTGSAVETDPYRATSAPLYQTATFAQESPTEFGEFDYTRTDNPTRRSTEALLAELEGAAHALCYASGMAAIAAVLRLVQPGERVLLGRDLYGGTQRFAHGHLPGVQVEHVDLEPDEFGRRVQLEAALRRGGVRLVLFETPSNPRLAITDIAAVAAIAHRHDALVVVDGTVMTPWLQRPLDLGADVVIHSATKGLAGHGDVTAGVVATQSAELAETLQKKRNTDGSALAPFESWLLARGVRTLGVRIERAQATALQLAKALQRGPGLEAVHYPGLESHPGHALHQSQATGAGVLITLEADTAERAEALVRGARLFSTAVSFGGVSSSISLPHHMSHASVPRGAAPRPGENLVRLSIGLESPDDLLEDLRQAMSHASRHVVAEPSQRVAAVSNSD
ncbi:Cystathionine gamma-lyase [Planctomycetes bacterium Poly30]|uniref:Cystathionine gamma-lyase n=1 Tax=Saltatorellus ferox TaxID=2528018 RepID=A0A518EQR6_9BACT|nr:Cystathionine gamma-lyase [Planctomycetes bacterium Poly30]